MKHCTKCGKYTAKTEFHKNSKTSDGLQSWCKPCSKEASKKWVAENPEKMKAHQDRIKYGVTPEHFQEMMSTQEGKCAICFTELIAGRKTCIDHNHETGKVRALLCSGCNKGIGFFKESEKAMLSAIEYLRKHNGH